MIQKIILLMGLMVGFLISCGDDPSGGTPDLKNVEQWFYYLGFDPTEEIHAQIEQSSYHMVVMEPIFNESNNADFPIADIVERYHSAKVPKLVLAYVDIGQAEEWRTYWRDGWKVGDPEWIIANDPDGWEGNYPVAYWHDDWREIWLGENGIMQGIVDVGFDGIYLDWVEAYSDENVITAAAAAGVDPEQEMVWWVEDLANFAREQNPDFVIIGQNAAELASNDDYVATIDAIAQEQTWFDGAADNNPSGDCPLPATEADIETQAYLESLSAECLELHNNFPDSTLHMSSEEYVKDLSAAKARGLKIFTVDYTVQEMNIQQVYATSRSLGFVPFASERALSIFVDPVN